MCSRAAVTAGGARVRGGLHGGVLPPCPLVEGPATALRGGIHGWRPTRGGEAQRGDEESTPDSGFQVFIFPARDGPPPVPVAVELLLHSLTLRISHWGSIRRPLPPPNLRYVLKAPLCIYDCFTYCMPPQDSNEAPTGTAVHVLAHRRPRGRRRPGQTHPARLTPKLAGGTVLDSSGGAVEQGGAGTSVRDVYSLRG